MPRNNRKDARTEKLVSLKVGTTPDIQRPPTAANVVVRKNLQDALIEGLEHPDRWCKYFLDIDPYEAQCDFLGNMRDCTEVNFVAGNRAGKTWVGGAVLLWKAFYRHIPPFTEPERQSPHNIYKAVSTSMTIDQAKLAWTYAHTFATSSPRFKRFFREAVYSPFPTLHLQTKNEKGEWVPSEVWARSLAKGAMYLLGQSINFLLVDECAYVPKYPHIEDEVLRMRLADTGGAIFRFSTANGRNFFYDIFLKGMPNPQTGERDPRIYSKTITTWDNPWVSKEYLLEQKERMQPEFYAQNVMGEFVSLSDFFKWEVIQGLYEDIEYTLNVPASRKGLYVMGVDLGALPDPTKIYILDVSKTPAQLVYVETVKNSRWGASREAVVGAYGLYNPVKTFVDATGVGAPIAEQLVQDDGLKNVNAFVFTASSKPDLLVKFQDAAQRKQFCFPYCNATMDLIHQMNFYRLDDKDIEQDAVMAMALCWGAAEEQRKGVSVQTNIADDLQILSSRGGRPPAGLFDEDEEEELLGGTEYMVDPRTGIFIPKGVNRWPFGIG